MKHQKSLIPSATVVLLSQNTIGSDFEVLLLRRNSHLTTHGGSWVFPGGKIDPVDFGSEGADDFYGLSDKQQMAIAKAAAVREAYEEAGTTLSTDKLKMCSTWLTPPSMQKRFDARFFLSCIDEKAVRIDEGEIHDYCWLSPAKALAKQAVGEITLPPPTFVTLTYLSRYNDASAAIDSLSSDPIHFKPRLTNIENGFCSVYQNDVAYEDLDLTREGPRHRLMMSAGIFEYIKSG